MSHTPSKSKDLVANQDEEEDQVDGEVEIVDKNVTYDSDSNVMDNLNEMELESDVESSKNGEEEAEVDEELMAAMNNKNDHSKQTITYHTGAVFCVDSFGKYVATGGEDDLAYVWAISMSSESNEISNFDLYLESEKFRDSVTNLKFSCDGKYLAAADMSGLIRVYLLEDKSVFWSFDLENDIELIRWHPSCNVLFCSTSDGYFYMFKISTNEIKIMYSGEQSSLSCFEILKDGKRAVCVYGNGALRCWDLKTSQALYSFTKCHDGEVLCSDLSPDGNLIATAGSDMKIHIRNTSNGKFVVDLACPKSAPPPGTTEKKKKEDDGMEESESESEEQDSIESLVFSKTFPFIACATLRGAIFVWDLQSHQMRHKFETGTSASGFTKILIDESSQLLYAGSLDGSVKVFDVRNLQLASRQYEGHSSEVLDFSLNRQFNLLLTASNDNTAKLYELNPSKH